jgi:hypothetical protein
MLSHVHSERLPAKAKAARLSLGALVSNNLVNSYTLINSIKQVIKSDTHL